MRARRGSPFDLNELGRCPGASSPGTALATRLDPHHPVAEIALHGSVEREDRAVGSTTVPTVPVSDDVFHGHSLSRRRPATGACLIGGRGRRGDRKTISLPRGGWSGPFRTRQSRGLRILRTGS